jgi:murein DD-endopeptidase MepM/ murein hydrolase activator NlpD
MSAIHDSSNNIGKVIQAYTKVKLEIFSHQSNKPIILTQEVSGFETSKDDKTAGTAAFALVPSKNWLNYIFPDDIVNFYIDRGDGKGLVRTFFGYVDSIRESCTRDQSGASNTTYKVNCSDFQKAFERCQVYFNQSLPSDRPDVDGKWVGAFNIGGLALASTGVAIKGSPPDALLNFIYLIMGSSGQFVLPNGLNPSPATSLRRQRVNYAFSAVREELKRVIPDGVNVDEFIKQAAVVSNNPNQAFELSDQMIQDLGISKDDPDTLASITSALAAAAKKLASTSLGSAASYGKTILTSVSTLPNRSLLDVIDTAGFIEREAIDGYMDNVAIWQEDGSLMNFISSVINEPINQLIFDLRPVQSDDYGKLADGTNWSTEADETGGNHEKGLPDGVRYVPAIVFRENPFSTINDLDLSNVKISLRDQNGALEPVGKMQFGAIFSDRPCVPGRHVITVNNINLDDYDSELDFGLKAQKHIDVAVVNPYEIISSDLGRSDNEVFNLLEIRSDSLMGTQERLFSVDILPIISPISVTRHGLRVKTVVTSLARFYLRDGSNTVAKGASEPEPSNEPKAIEFTGDISYPMDNYKFSRRFAEWRKKYPKGSRVTDTPNAWRLHLGVDLAAPTGTPVKAVADGYIVAVAPTGTEGFNNYGNTIVIEHAKPYNGSKVYSVYAHLNGFEQSIQQQTNPSLSETVKGSTSAPFRGQGKMPKFPVRAGQVIGYCGATDVKSEALRNTSNYPIGKPRMGPHLHFEITKAVPSIVGAPVVPYTGPTAPAAPDYASLRAMDPEAFFAAAGLDLRRPGEVPDDDSEDGMDDDADVSDSDDSGNQNSSPDTADGDPVKAIDNYRVRQQAIRWGFLIDHWNQHNAEYLSGSITMRGAPEIRVGYRLDIPYEDGPLSFYVQSVQHSWRYGDKMTTTLTVTRGQRNDNFPLYVLPYLKGSAETQRQAGSRLGETFTVGDNHPPAKGGYFVKANQIAARDSVPINVDEYLAQNGNKELMVAQNSSLVAPNKVGPQIKSEVDQSIVDSNNPLKDK